MNQIPLYPMRFDPIYQYRIWGGRRLSVWLSAPLPGEGPIGEAWLLSDRDDHASIVAQGPLKGWTIRQLLKQYPLELMGKLAGCFKRFPLLLKLLDVLDTLSVQVHPSDSQTNLLPAGETGKTEAWVVLETGPESRIYAGLKPNTTKEELENGLANGTVETRLSSFRPKTGESVLIPAGTAHSLGDVVVFEVQENSDVTFRLYDWNHIDPRTGKPRHLQTDEAMACLDYTKVGISPVVPVVEDVKPVLRERMLHCEYFGLWRLSGESEFTVGEAGAPRVLVCIAGEGLLKHQGASHAFRKGDALLLPAIVGPCLCMPFGEVTLLEISLPDGT